MENIKSPLPKIVSGEEWKIANQAFLKKEKEFTHFRDALAAQRRRLPMVHIEKEYIFDGANGKASLLDLFDGNRQLLLYHFMFAPGVGGWPTAGCPGCSMFVDNIGQFAPIHLKARGVAMAIVSLAPIENIEGYRKRMGWQHRWVSSAHNSFNKDFGVTTSKGETHGLSVFLRDDDKIFRTYFTTERGCEAVGNVWGFLDVTPFGRQELWEDSPEGWPQDEPYNWWRRHDEYGK